MPPLFCRAIKNGKGLHSKKEVPIHRVADISGVRTFWRAARGAAAPAVPRVRLFAGMGHVEHSRRGAGCRRSCTARGPARCMRDVRESCRHGACPPALPGSAGGAGTPGWGWHEGIWQPVLLLWGWWPPKCHCRSGFVTPGSPRKGEMRFLLGVSLLRGAAGRSHCLPWAGIAPSVGDEGDPTVPRSFAAQGSRGRAGYVHKPAERGCVLASILGLMPRLSRRSFVSSGGTELCPGHPNSCAVLGTPIPAHTSLLPCF